MLVVYSILADNSQVVAHVAGYNIHSGYCSFQVVTLVRGSMLLRCHDDLSPEQVTLPEDAHLRQLKLQWDWHGLRQEAHSIHRQAEHPEGREYVAAILHAAGSKKIVLV